MRLIPVCLPLVLASLISSPPIAAGQQPQPSSTQKTQPTSAVKQSSAVSPKSATNRKSHRVTHKRHSKKRKATKRAQYRPDHQKNSVEVINGDATKQVVFQDEAAAVPAKGKTRQSKNAPAPMKVEVINGSATDTQYFSNDNQETARNRSVVVGVQSSDTRYAGGNKNQVVTAVTSSSSADAKSASSGGQPVAKQISPHSKRPAYQPDAH